MNNFDENKENFGDNKHDAPVQVQIQKPSGLFTVSPPRKRPTPFDNNSHNVINWTDDLHQEPQARMEDVIVRITTFEQAPYIDFHSCRLGRTKIVRLILENSTNEVSKVVIEKYPHSGFEVDDLGVQITLQAKERHILTARFVPKRPGNHRDTLHFRANHMPLSVILHGIGIEAPHTHKKRIKVAPVFTTISVDDEPLDFSMAMSTPAEHSKTSNSLPFLQSSGARTLKPTTLFNVEASPMVSTQTFRRTNPLTASSPTGKKLFTTSTASKMTPSLNRTMALPDEPPTPIAGDQLSMSRLQHAKANQENMKTPQLHAVKASEAPQVKKAPLSRLAQKAIGARQTAKPSATATSTSHSATTAKSSSTASSRAKREAPSGQMVQDLESSKRRKVVFSREKMTSAAAEPSSKKTPAPMSSRSPPRESDWMEKQEVSATSWLNFILSSPENTQPVPDVATNDIASNKAVGSIRALVKWAAANGAAKHRVEAHRIFSSVEAKTVVQRILLEVTEGRIGIRDDKLLWADMGVRQNIINLLLCYSEPYLALGLEIMYNQVINDQSSKNLSKFITQHLLFNEPIASKFETQVKKHYRDGFKEELHKFTLHSFLTLVWLLDELKCSDVLPHCHTLFHKDSTIKASKQVLIAFCKDYMLGEGDVVRHLALVGYRVRYEQMFIEEFDFSVANIANDLKDGIRLVKVADVLGSRAASPLPPSLNKLRVPAVSRLQKIHNVEVALEKFKELGINVQEISGRDVVDGHRGKTLALLWKVIMLAELPNVLHIDKITKEIEHIRQSTFRRRASLPEVDNELQAEPQEAQTLYINSPIINCLLEWSRLICSSYGLPVTNLTSSFSDGKALCYIVNYYFPEALPLSSIKPTTRDLQKKLNSGASEEPDSIPDAPKKASRWTATYSPPSAKGAINPQMRAALEGEKHNFNLVHNAAKAAGFVPLIVRAFDMSNTTPDEKVVVTYLSYLASRLIELRRQREHIVMIQKIARGFLTRQHLADTLRRIKAERTIGAFIMMCRDRIQFLRARRAAIKIQSRWRGVSQQRDYQLQKNAASVIQHAWRNYVERENQRIAQEHQALVNATILVQSIVRTRLAQRELNSLRKAALVIQRACSARRERTAFIETRQAAITIQSAARMKLERQHFTTTVHSIVQVQAIARGLLARKETRRIRAAIAVQTAARAFLARRELEAKKNAAVKLQSMARMMIQRCEFVEKRNAAIILQAAARKTMCQSQFAEMKHAAVVIQAEARRIAAQRNFQKDRESIIAVQALIRSHEAQSRFAELKTAAIIIQLQWRAELARRDQKRENAATKIQSVARAFVARKIYTEQRDAAIKIQAWWRMVAARHDFRALKEASICIQSFVRGVVARQQYLELWTATQKRIQERREAAAAIKIQAIARMVDQRKQYLAIRDAAIKIQSLHRGNVDRSVVAKIHVARETSATKIQAWWKMIHQRQVYNKDISSIVFVQSIARGVLARREAERERAAVRIQAWWRGVAQRKAYLATKDATIHLQAQVRGMIARQNFVKSRDAANKIQAATRGFLERRRYLRKKEAALTIESAIVTYQARKSFAELRTAALIIQSRWTMIQQAKKYKQSRAAVVTIQTACRGYLARKQLLRERSATKIQAWWKMIQQQRQYAETREAIIKVQAKARGVLARKEAQRERAAIRIQAWWRSMRQQRQYQINRRAIILLQSTVRAVLAQKEFEAKKRAAIIIQARAKSIVVRKQFLIQQSAVAAIESAYITYRARKAFVEMRYAATVIQSWWRMIQCKHKYQKTRNAIVAVQTGARAYLARKQLLREKSAVKIQSWWRMVQQRRQYEQEIVSIVQIQAVARGALARKQARLERAAVRIQAWWRSVRQQKAYQEARAAIVKIQSVVRMRSLRAEYQLARTRVLQLQDAIRGLVTRQRAEERSLAVVSIQTAARGYLARKEQASRFEAAVVIQRASRAHRAREEFKQQRDRIIQVQAAARAVLARREYKKRLVAHREQANLANIVLIQNAFRAAIERNAAHRQVAAVTRVQAIVRGILTRQRTSKAVAEMRRQIAIANAQAKHSMTLAARTKDALQIIVVSSKISDLMAACTIIETSTKYSALCALQCMELKVVPIIFAVLAELNRSAPHLYMLKLVLNVLVNLGRWRESRPLMSIQHPAILYELTTLIAKYKEATDIVLRALELFTLLVSHDAELARSFAGAPNIKPDANPIQRLEAVHDQLKKRLAIEIKGKKHESIVSQTKAAVSDMANLIDIIRALKSRRTPAMTAHLGAASVGTNRGKTKGGATSTMMSSPSATGPQSRLASQLLRNVQPVVKKL